MATVEKDSRRGAAPASDRGQRVGQAQRAGAKPRLAHTIISPQAACVKIGGGQVALILRPGHAPEVQMTATTEREQAALTPLLDTARRLAELAAGGGAL